MAAFDSPPRSKCALTRSECSSEEPPAGQPFQLEPNDFLERSSEIVDLRQDRVPELRRVADERVRRADPPNGASSHGKQSSANRAAISAP